MPVLTLPAIGARIRYTGDMANPSGFGYVVRVRIADAYTQDSRDVALDDGRYIRAVAHFDEGFGCRFVTVPDHAPADPAEVIARIRAEEQRRAAAEQAACDKKTRETQQEVTGREIAARLIPADCPALIVARLKKDESDSQTDYFAHSVTRVIVLALSKHKRHLFPELRKAATRFEPTKVLALEGVEHRENYSMGSGMYLSDADYSHAIGWEVRKVTRWRDDWDAEIYRSLAQQHCLSV
jgi:hypothetical protein